MTRLSGRRENAGCDPQPRRYKHSSYPTLRWSTHQSQLMSAGYTKARCGSLLPLGTDPAPATLPTHRIAYTHRYFYLLLT